MLSLSAGFEPEQDSRELRRREGDSHGENHLILVMEEMEEADNDNDEAALTPPS